MQMTVEKSEVNLRLDLFLLQRIPKAISRSFVQRAIKEGKVTVNDVIRKPNYRVKFGDVVKISIPSNAQSISIEPEPIQIGVIYEDEDIIVVNKPAGMIVHPIPSHNSGTLVNALLYHCKDLKGIGGELRPGIVHRLDKDTSGVMVVAKNDFAHHNLSNQFKDRKVFKMYLALVSGKVEHLEGDIQISIARHPVLRTKMAASEIGRIAVTHYKVIKYFEHATLLMAFPKTGRTHQIRVHMKCINHPILGDKLYGKGSGASRQMLHATKLGFYHPRTHEWIEFIAPLPEDFKETIRLISSGV
ncbi:pseudouridine synthase [Pseudothermotoga lettingae TMO]|nr:pseudouridine synthase [Pseudothermotoga lettingae TMO]